MALQACDEAYSAVVAAAAAMSGHAVSPNTPVELELKLLNTRVDHAYYFIFAISILLCAIVAERCVSASSSASSNTSVSRP